MEKDLSLSVLIKIIKAQWSLYVPPGSTATNSTFYPRSVFMCFCVDLRTNSHYFNIN